MQIKRRYRDYPPNVPKKLFRVLKSFDFDRSKTAIKLQVNPGYLSQLLNKGIEPSDTTIKGRKARKALFLHVRKEQPIKEKRIHQQRPQYITEWLHLPTEERQRVIKQYMDWKKAQSVLIPK